MTRLTTFGILSKSIGLSFLRNLSLFVAKVRSKGIVSNNKPPMLTYAIGRMIPSKVAQSMLIELNSS